MVYVFIFLVLIFLGAIATVGTSGFVFSVCASAIGVGYYFFWKKTEEKQCVPPWQYGLYKTAPWIWMILGGLAAFVGLIWFVVGMGTGEQEYASKVCGWCNGFGCSHCYDSGHKIYTETRYENTNFWFGALWAIFGASFAVLGYFTRGNSSVTMKIPEKKELTPKQKALLKKWLTISAIALAVIGAIVLVVINWIVPPIQYAKAADYERDGAYLRAAVTYGSLGDYKDAKARSWDLWQAHGATSTFSADAAGIVAIQEGGSVVTNDGTLSWTNIKSISVGYDYILALREDGTVVTDNEEINVANWQGIVAIDAGDRALGLKYDGTVVSASAGHIYLGDVTKGKIRDVNSWEEIVAVCSGGNHIVGLKADGTVVAVGNNADRQCEVSKWRNVVDIAAGYNFTVGLKADGTVLCTQSRSSRAEDFGQFEAANWQDIVAIDADSYYVVGVKKDGSVVFCGKGTDHFAQWTDVAAIATGNGFTIAMQRSGEILCTAHLSANDWRNIQVPNNVAVDKEGARAQAYTEAEAHLAQNDQLNAAICFGKAGNYRDAQLRSRELWGQICLNSTLVCAEGITVAVREDGTVVATDSNFPQISAWKDIQSVSLSHDTLVGLKKDGTLVCTADRYDLSGWQNIVAVSVGSNHIAAIRTDGTVVTAGSNSQGQCNTQTWRQIISVSVQEGYTLGLCADGTVVVTGEYEGYISNWLQVTAIEAGTWNACAVTESGRLLNSKYTEELSAWGGLQQVYQYRYNTLGLRFDGTLVYSDPEEEYYPAVLTWTDVVAADVSDTHIVALRKDGTVVAAGNNEGGQCNVSDWNNIALPNPQTVVLEQRYQRACAAFAQGEYDTAGQLFAILGDYEDAPEYLARLMPRVSQTTQIRYTVGSYKGNQTVTHFDEYGNAESPHCERVYENGVLVKEIYEDGIRTYENGHILSEEFPDWKLSSEFTLDDAGRVLSRIATIQYANSRDDMILEYHYTYNDQGLLCRETFLNHATGAHYEEQTEYTSGRATKITHNDGFRTTVTFVAYDANGLRVQDTVCRSTDTALVPESICYYVQEFAYSLIP